MSRSQQVYNIVKSFSRGEKRQFKLQTYTYEKSAKHISAQLFDLFDSMDTWNDKLFQQKVKNAQIGKSAAVHINTLLNQLLDSLRSKESKYNIVFQINKLVEESIVLSSRDEFQLAINRIGKAKSLAIDAELYTKLLEILAQERSIQFRQMAKSKYNAYRLQYFEEVKDTLNKLDTEAEYLNLVEEIFNIYSRIGYPEDDEERKRYKDIVEHPLIKDKTLATTSDSLSNYFFVHIIYFQSLHDLKNARETIDEQVSLFEQNKQYAKTHINSYISILNNLAVLVAQQELKSEFKKVIKKMRAIPGDYGLQNKLIEQRVFELSYSVEVDFLMVRSQFKEIESLIPIIEKKINQYCKEGASFARFVNLALHVAIYYYRTGDPDRAHIWTKKVLDETDTLNTIYISLFSIILDLVLHFKEGDYSYLQYRLTSVQKYFRKHKQLIPMNDQFFKSMKKLSTARNMDQVDSILAKLTKTYSEMPGSVTRQFYDKYLAIEELIADKFGMSDKFGAE